MRELSVLLAALEPPTTVENGHRVATNLDNVLTILEDAERFDPDVVCFPEIVLQSGYRGDALNVDDVLQPIPGPATEAVGEHARALNSYVVLPMKERNGDQYHNSAAFIGPDGEVVDVYRKLVPALGEFDAGTTPGTEVKVWETPFGRVGILICMDVKFPEVGVHLGRLDADLVLFPSFGHADSRLRTWATYHGYHVALCDRGEARFYSPAEGLVAGNTSQYIGNPTLDHLDLAGGEARFAYAEVNTNQQSFQRSMHSSAMTEVQRVYSDSLVFHEAGPEGVTVIESVDPDVDIDEVAAEFGLVATSEYENGMRARVTDAVENSPIMALKGQNTPPVVHPDDHQRERSPERSTDD